MIATHSVRNDRGCAKLTEDMLSGRKTDGETSCKSNDKGCMEQSLTVLRQLYPDEPVEYKPKSPPATWRSDLARFVFLHDDDALHGMNRSRVNLVPTFWQMVKSGQMTNYSNKDCTHKSFSAVIMMNFQLARAMMDNQLK